MPFYLIDQRGMDPEHAGMLLSVQPLVMAVAAPISGTISDRVRSGLLSAVGMLVLAAGATLLSLLATETPYSYLVVAMSVTGLGTGIFISPEQQRPDGLRAAGATRHRRRNARHGPQRRHGVGRGAGRRRADHRARRGPGPNAGRRRA